jgi:cysteine desulfurase
VSLILAHNEIGSLYNLKAMAELKAKHEFILHWDATQALLTEPIHEAIDSFDMLSLSAHKLYGPKGVGALFLKKTTVGHQLEPLISGGDQEFGLRSGTLNVPGIVGLGEACKIVLNRRDQDLSHFKTLSQSFKNLLLKNLVIATFNGDPEQRIFQNISLTLPGSYTNMDLMSHFNGFCLSQGSACGSMKTKSNPVLSAIGLTESQMTRTLRVGLGRNTTEQDLEKFVDRLANQV